MECYKLCNIAPSYLSEVNYVFTVSCSDSRLRSTARGNYVIPRARRYLADGAFAVVTRSVFCNCQSYTNVLSELKTYFLALHFMIYHLLVVLP